MLKIPQLVGGATVAVLSMLLAGPVDNVQARLGDPNSYVEAMVRSSFADAPDMVAIAKCESGIRQFNADGSVLKGGGGKKYVGIFQIDGPMHSGTAAGLGFDINTAEGNIGYARFMYLGSGTRPWASCVPAPSEPASEAMQPAPTPASGKGVDLTVNLGLGMTNPQVLGLQKFLNSNGYVIAPSGPGSPGSETSFFGTLTREAVRRYQCAKGVACTGNESTTGYGRVGPTTRASMR